MQRDSAGSCSRLACRSITLPPTGPSITSIPRWSVRIPSSTTRSCSSRGTRCKQSRPSILRALLMHIVRIICLCMFLHHLPSQSFLLLSYYRVFLTLNSSFAPVYPANHTLDVIADTYGKQARGVLHAGDAPGRPLNTYVNYASTDETPEQMYGYEPWRLAKLRALKEKYDPKGRFNFYAPVNP